MQQLKLALILQMTQLWTSFLKLLRLGYEDAWPYSSFTRPGVSN